MFVRLEQLTDPALVAAEIASALGHRAGTDGPGADGLGQYLRDMELLLVLDNFEHLLPVAVLVSELLELAPQIQVLVTSRTATADPWRAAVSGRAPGPAERGVR